MPFTFAHPMYAVPVKRIVPRYFSVTGLVLGSMAPDFEYFIMLEPFQYVGHTVWGLLLEAIPLCVLFALLFHLIMKEQLARHLPAWRDMDLRAMALISRWRLTTVGAWFIFISSVTIGFGSHVLVDSFTHQGGWDVQQFPLLQAAAAGIPIYKWVQHSLSLLGLAIEGYWIICIGRQVRVSRLSLQPIRTTSSDKLIFWTIVAMSAFLVLTVKLLCSDHTNVIGVIVVAPMSGAVLGVLAASLHAWWSNRTAK